MMNHRLNRGNAKPQFDECIEALFGSGKKQRDRTLTAFTCLLFLFSVMFPYQENE